MEPVRWPGLQEKACANSFLSTAALQRATALYAARWARNLARNFPTARHVAALGACRNAPSVSRLAMIAAAGFLAQEAVTDQTWGTYWGISDF